VEAEIARILGKAEWNEVVLEARSAVSGKPVDELKKEIARKFEEREKTFKADFANKQSRVDAALESRATDAYRKRRAG
jgi:5-hydroxyisourate hydrolase-like protein (transthyretin family)